MLYSLRSLERSVRRRLTSDLGRKRFDRARQFVDEAKRRSGGEMALRLHARWLKFLCCRTAVQSDIWPQQTEFLNQFATVFGIAPAERRGFVGLSLLGRLWYEWCFNELMKGPPEVLARLMRVTAWEHFENCRQDGAGLILLPVHGQFSRLFRPYLRHLGHDSLEVGLTSGRLEEKGLVTPATKRFELARQMHAAKHRLAQGGIACNLPDARQNLDNSRPVEFFGRKRLRDVVAAHASQPCQAIHDAIQAVWGPDPEKPPPDYHEMLAKKIRNLDERLRMMREKK